ncbi:MAG TPA: helix-turn-helix domain-containing protein [Rhizomicrobium sp.]
MEAPGLAYWSAAVAEKTVIDEDAYARMIAHPRFGEACIRSAHNVLARLEGNSVAARLAKDLSRIFYGIFALYLDARGELTLTGIQEFCVETGLASPGRAAAILVQLRMMGYVVLDTSPTATRRQRYVPAPVMKEAVRETFRDELMTMALLDPEAGSAADRLDDPETFRQFILFLGMGFANIARRRDTNVLTPFAARNAGLPILYHIATSGQADDTYPPKGNVRISVKEIARRFEVSRSHVLRLLREVEGLGYLRRNPDETTGVIEEPLREALIHNHAAAFMGIASCIHRAMQRIETDLG